MKKTTLKKALSIFLAMLALCLVAALPVAAGEPEPFPQIQVNPDFNANNAIRDIFDWLGSIIAIICIAAGAVLLVLGFINQDNKEKIAGLISILLGFGVIGLMQILLNQIIL